MSAGATAPGGAYAGRRVLVTGHTGFKGAWLVAWLRRLGAQVTGFSLAPEPGSMFERLELGEWCTHRVGDVRDFEQVRALVAQARPEVLFHLAAQSLVPRGYAEPLLTFDTNARGTAHVLEAVRVTGLRCAVVVVTSDKCYENDERGRAFAEGDPLGGRDPYSMSKGAAELVTGAWRSAYFPPARLGAHGVAVASARAGNVLGGGDWSPTRLVPDCVRAFRAGQTVALRSPGGVRPWQHVLDPLAGYLELGARLPAEAGLCEAWNFGPADGDARPVRELVDALARAWGSGTWVDASDGAAPHEAGVLRLSTEKARARLGWRPRWRFEEAVARTVEWYRAEAAGADAATLRSLTLAQLADYERA